MTNNAKQLGTIYSRENTPEMLNSSFRNLDLKYIDYCSRAL